MNRELCLSSLADNGGFALEYYLNGERKENLIKDGIEYCDLLIKTISAKPEDYLNDNEKYERIDTIQKYYSPEELSSYKDVMKSTKDVLESILNYRETNIKYEDIRMYQHFFNESSTRFLSGAFNKLRRKSFRCYI